MMLLGAQAADTLRVSSPSGKIRRLEIGQAE